MNQSVKKVYIYSNGCIENIQDAVQFSNYLGAHNFQLTNDPKKAGLLIVNTCAVARLKVIFSINKIKEFQSKKKKDAILAVSGCLPRIDEGALREVFDGPIIDVRNPNGLADLLGLGLDRCVEDYPSNTIGEPFLSDYKGFTTLKRIIEWLKVRKLPFPSRIDRRIREYEDEKMFYIKISEGCLSNCSYCAIKIAKGKLKSKPLDKIISEFKQALEKGYKRIILCGDETGSYGLDIDSSFLDLLVQLTHFEGNYKIGIRSLSPSALIKYFSIIKRTLDREKISLLSVPIQSGSDKILERMKRDYRAEDIIVHLREIKSKYPQVMLRTHIIVGFPGETEEDFRKSMQVINAIDFDCVIPVIFSAMRGTEAFDYRDQLPLLTKNMRFFRMLLKSVYNIYFRKQSYRLRKVGIAKL